MAEQNALYIHFPWCIRKCPYCDFNSHETSGALPEADYVDALIRDLEADILTYGLTSNNCEISSIFMGGGTPSLFSPEMINRLMVQVRERLNLRHNIEVTMEVNPGSITTETADSPLLISRSGETELLGAEKLSGFFEAGINRLSIGFQSLNEAQLASLGRIHSPTSATETYSLARSLGFTNINIDLMHGLPNQTYTEAMTDLQKVIDLRPNHISWYQLTIEPNTVFYKRPPNLPDEDTLWDIYESGLTLLAENGFTRYEVSAFSQPGRQSQHNLNYWTYGNYLGVGAGAHSKQIQEGELVRASKTRLPKDYLANPNAKSNPVPPDELLLEYLMNTLRLAEGFTYDKFEARTGLNQSALLPFIKKAKAKSLITETTLGIKPTATGLQYLNELLLLA